MTNGLHFKLGDTVEIGEGNTYIRIFLMKTIKHFMGLLSLAIMLFIVVERYNIGENVAMKDETVSELEYVTSVVVLLLVVIVTTLTMLVGSHFILILLVYVKQVSGSLVVKTSQNSTIKVSQHVTVTYDFMRSCLCVESYEKESHM